MDWSPVGGRFPHSSTILPAGREGEGKRRGERPRWIEGGVGGWGAPIREGQVCAVLPTAPLPKDRDGPCSGSRRKEGDYSRSVELEGWMGPGWGCRCHCLRGERGKNLRLWCVCQRWERKRSRSAFCFTPSVGSGKGSLLFPLRSTHHNPSDGSRFCRVPGMDSVPQSGYSLSPACIFPASPSVPTRKGVKGCEGGRVTSPPPHHRIGAPQARPLVRKDLRRVLSVHLSPPAPLSYDRRSRGGPNHLAPFSWTTNTTPSSFSFPTRSPRGQDPVRRHPPSGRGAPTRRPRCPPLRSSPLFLSRPWIPSVNLPHASARHRTRMDGWARCTRLRSWPPT